MVQREDRQKVGKFANVVRCKKAHKTTVRPDYETPEGAVTFEPGENSGGGRVGTNYNVPSPISLPRVKWMERPDPCQT